MSEHLFFIMDTPLKLSEIVSISALKDCGRSFEINVYFSGNFVIINFGRDVVREDADALRRELINAWRDYLD